MHWYIASCSAVPQHAHVRLAVRGIKKLCRELSSPYKARVAFRYGFFKDLTGIRPVYAASLFQIFTKDN